MVDFVRRYFTDSSGKRHEIFTTLGDISARVDPTEEPMIVTHDPHPMDVNVVAPTTMHTIIDGQPVSVQTQSPVHTLIDGQPVAVTFSLPVSVIGTGGGGAITVTVPGTVTVAGAVTVTGTTTIAGNVNATVVGTVPVTGSVNATIVGTPSVNATLVGTPSVVMDHGTVNFGGVNYTIKYAAINVPTGVDTTVVAAVTGKKIRILAIMFSVSVLGTVEMRSNATGVLGPFTCAVGAPFELNLAPYGYLMETVSGQAFRMLITGLLSVCRGVVSYIEV